MDSLPSNDLAEGSSNPSSTVGSDAAAVFVSIEDPSPPPFVPSLGAWVKPLTIPKVLQDPLSETLMGKSKNKSKSEIPSSEIKEDGQLQFSWAAKMDQSIRNLYRTTSPSYMEDGTPKVHIPNHVLMEVLENQKEYVIGQFYRSYTPSGDLIHAVANRIWGKKWKFSPINLVNHPICFIFRINQLGLGIRAWVMACR